ncbi:hypothetical protein CVT24_011821, partial [Panaeolus cyanescens]
FVTEALQITLPKLVTLCIQGEKDEERSLFRALDTPLLEHFLFYPPYLPFYLNPNTAAPSNLLNNADSLDCSPVCSFLRQCSALKTLTINPVYLSGAEILAIFQSCSQITALVLDQHDRMCFSLDGQVSNHSMHLNPVTAFNLYPLFKQQLVLHGSATIEQLPQILLPCLKSFTVLGFYVPDIQSLELLEEFCVSRIYPPHMQNQHWTTRTGTSEPPSGSNSNTPPSASLEEIVMRLSGVGEGLVAIIRLYAESVGRRVGEDIEIDIQYQRAGEAGVETVWPFVETHWHR